jgi:hypothetical protein
MAINRNPMMTNAGIVGMARIDAGAKANASADGSGTLQTLFTAGADGYLPLKVKFTGSPAAYGTSLVKKGRIYISDGANNRLYKEGVLAAVTSAVGTITTEWEYSFPDGFILPSGWSVKVDTSVYTTAADQVDIIGYAGSYTL